MNPLTSSALEGPGDRALLWALPPATRATSGKPVTFLKACLPYSAEGLGEGETVS